MASLAGERASLPPKVIRELARELRSLVEAPPEGIRVLPEEDVGSILADIEGPADTPYSGGLFHMRLQLSADYPQAPPKGFFETRIFHPNVAKSGDICVSTLSKDWKPTLGVRHVLLVIRCLLIEPYPESALNEEAGKLLMEDYEGYARHARLMTRIHALPKAPAFRAKAAPLPLLPRVPGVAGKADPAATGRTRSGQAGAEESQQEAAPPLAVDSVNHDGPWVRRGAGEKQPAGAGAGQEAGRGPGAASFSEPVKVGSREPSAGSPLPSAPSSDALKRVPCAPPSGSFGSSSSSGSKRDSGPSEGSTGASKAAAAMPDRRKVEARKKGLKRL